MNKISIEDLTKLAKEAQAALLNDTILTNVIVPEEPESVEVEYETEDEDGKESMEAVDETVLFEASNSTIEVVFSVESQNEDGIEVQEDGSVLLIDVDGEEVKVLFLTTLFPKV